MSQQPYSGIRVVELGARTSAGVCGRLLADLGACVYAVEPRQGSATGKWADRVSALAGKHSLLADPQNPADVEPVAQLIRACEVAILSSDLDGADWPACWREALADCPIVCDLSAFGSSGPLAGQCVDELALQALSGVMHTTGLPGGAPTAVGVPVIDMSAGLYAAGAVALALGVYQRSGVGQAVEVAHFDVAISSLTTFMTAHYAGKAPQRLGNGHGMAVPWNAYPTSDGWVLICSTNDAQWRRIAACIGPAAQGDERFALLESRLQLREEVDALVRAWTLSHTVAGVEERLNEAGIPCGRIVPLGELADEANLKMRQSVHTVRDPLTGEAVRVSNAIIRFLGHTPEPAQVPEPDSARAMLASLRPLGAPPRSGPVEPAAALAGLRVVEVGQLTTAPLAARHLASFGADVIKVEPPEGESARAWAPLRSGVSHFFVASNGEKRSVALDLRSERDRTYLSELLRDADVLVENMKPGALARLGFDQARLQALNPRLVYCAISGFGLASVYPGRAAVDTVIQAMSGMMDATRSADTPVKAGISAADILGGQAGLLAIVAALAARDRTGQGAAIDISMQDVGAWTTQRLWNRQVCAAPLPERVASVAEACTHPQTLARSLILQRPDAQGQTWEVLASPMRLARTPPRIGSLIGAPSRQALRWRPR